MLSAVNKDVTVNWPCEMICSKGLPQKGEPYPREPFWSTSLAVGIRQRIAGLVGDDREAQKCIVPLNSGDSGTCKLNVTQSLYQRMMKHWQKDA